MDKQEFIRLCQSGTCRRMTEEVTEIFMQLVFAEIEIDNGAPEPPLPKVDGKIYYTLQVLKLRAQAIQPDHSNPLLLFLWVKYEGIIGRALLVLHYLHALKPGKRLDLSLLSVVFPNGFWTDEAIDRIWQTQKLQNGSNYIDQLLREIVKV